MSYRVLMVTRRLPVGGAEYHILHLARGLMQRGHVVHVLAGEGDLAQKFRAEGIPLHPAPGLARGYGGVFQETRYIRSLVRAHRIDIVHTHALAATLVAAVALRRETPAVPLVTAVHNLHRGSWPARQVAGLLLRILPKHTIFLSHHVLRQVAATVFRAPRAASIISNGVDLTSFLALEKGSWQRSCVRVRDPEGTVLVGAVARLSPEKGHRYLLDAWRTLIQRRSRCQLLLVGDGPERSTLERQVAEHNLNSTVFFRGQRDDIATLLQGLDLFVLPSLRESNPVALLEAMAAALPVVATRVGGVPEVLEDGVHGVLVPPRNPTALAEAILWLLDNRDRAAQMGALARERVIENFSLETMVEQVLKVYEVVSNGQGS